MYSLGTLGRLVLNRDGTPVPGFDAHRQALALLAVLAAEGSATRDRLMALFWPESDTARARGSLKQVLHQLRHLLDAPDLVTGTASLALNPDQITSDVAEFLAALDRGDDRAAITLYRGPFLDGVHLGASTELENWLDLRRADLARRQLGALERVALATEKTGAAAAASEWWRRMLQMDPADSRVLLRLMQSLEASGQRAAALRAAEAHTRQLQDDWGTAPDPEVAALARRLRISAPAKPLAPPAPPAPPALRQAEAPPVAPRRSLTVPTVLTASATILAAAIAWSSIRAGRQPAAEAADPNLIAIAPFSTLGDSLEPWREGLADVLALDLDGAGPLRTVARSVVMRTWPGEGDRAAADSLGRRTGAGLVVYGSARLVSPDSLAVRARVLDRNDGSLADVEVSGVASRMGALIDSLGLGILRAVGQGRPIASSRRVSLGARSLPGLREFLRGEQFYRRGEWDSAMAHYDRALTHDSTLALALRRMAVVPGWGSPTGQDYRPATEYRRRAIAANRGLAPRDSLVLLADAFAEAAVSAASPAALVRNLYQARATIEEAAQRYPDDPDIWYEVGEFRYHWPMPIGGPPVRILEAFERAIALDPGFSPAYEHAIEVAIQLGRLELALRRARTAARLVTGRDATDFSLAALLIDSGAAHPAAAKALEDASPNSLVRLGRDHFAWATDSGLAAAAALRRLVSRPLGEGRLPPVIINPVVRTRYLALALAFRGQLRDAAAAGSLAIARGGPAKATPWVDPFLDLALLGAVPDSVARRTFELAFSPATAWGGPLLRTQAVPLQAAPWWAARRDTTSLHRLAKRAIAVARNPESPLAAMRGRYLHAAALAWLALARGDSLDALRRLEAIPDTLCLAAVCFHEKIALARLLAERGDHAQAAALLDQWGGSGGASPVAVLAALDRARIAERLADTTTAGDRYRFVADAWRYADPELQPHVAEARAALARLANP